MTWTALPAQELLNPICSANIQFRNLIDTQLTTILCTALTATPKARLRDQHSKKHYNNRQQQPVLACCSPSAFVAFQPRSKFVCEPPRPKASESVARPAVEGCSSRYPEPAELRQLLPPGCVIAVCNIGLEYPPLPA